MLQKCVFCCSRVRVVLESVRGVFWSVREREYVCVFRESVF